MYLLSDRFNHSLNGIGRDSRNFQSALEEIGQETLVIESRNFRKTLLIGRKYLNLEGDKTIVLSPQVGILIPVFFKPTIWAVRIHDLFPLTDAKYFKLKSRILFYLGLKLAILKKATFLANSISTATELQELFPQVTNIKVIECETSYELTDELCNACHSCEFIQDRMFEALVFNFLLMVGTIEPRKGYREFLEIYAQLQKKRIEIAPVVLVGKIGWKSNFEVEKLRELKNIYWMETTCDGSLKILYNSAKCLVSNSTNEGFGLPIFEARNLGCPVIARNIPIYHDLHGNNIGYFDPGSLEDLLTESKSIQFQDLRKRKELHQEKGKSNFKKSLLEWVNEVSD